MSPGTLGMLIITTFHCKGIKLDTIFFNKPWRIEDWYINTCPVIRLGENEKFNHPFQQRTRKFSNSLEKRTKKAFSQLWIISFQVELVLIVVFLTIIWKWLPSCYFQFLIVFLIFQDYSMSQAFCGTFQFRY